MNNNQPVTYGFEAILGSKLIQFSTILDQKLTAKTYATKPCFYSRCGKIVKPECATSYIQSFVFEGVFSKQSLNLLDREINKLSYFVKLENTKNESPCTITQCDELLIEKIKDRILADAVVCSYVKESGQALNDAINIFNCLLKQIYISPTDFYVRNINAICNIEYLMNACFSPCEIDVKHNGFCLALTSTFVNALLCDDLATFAQRLQLISEDINKGLLFFGKTHYSYEYLLYEAYDDYRYFKNTNQSLSLDHTELYNLFSKISPDAFQLMELNAWLNVSLLSQYPEKTTVNYLLPQQNFIKQFELIASSRLQALIKAKNDDAALFFTEYWPAVVFKNQLARLLLDFSEGLYVCCTTDHIFAINVESDYLLFCDSRLHSFFLKIAKIAINNYIDKIFYSFLPKDGSNFSICAFLAVALKEETAHNKNKELQKIAFDSLNIADHYENPLMFRNECEDNILDLALNFNNVYATQYMLTNSKIIDYIKQVPGHFAYHAAKHGSIDLLRAFLAAGDQRLYTPPDENITYFISSFDNVRINILAITLELEDDGET